MVAPGWRAHLRDRLDGAAGVPGTRDCQEAVRALLQLACDADRWGLVHAFPATTNGRSNGICRSVGFRLAGQKDVTFAGRVIHTNHWVINPRTNLT